MIQKKESAIMQDIGMAFLTWKRYCQKKEALPYGITLKQLYVLKQLSREKSLYPSDIAEMLFCDRPTATVVIKNMEKHGWVKRDMDSRDSRRIMVTMKPAGHAKLKEIKEKQAISQGELFDPLDCFDSREKATLSKLLAKLNHHLKQIKEKM